MKLPDKLFYIYGGILIVLIASMIFIGIQVYGINTKLNHQPSFVESISRISKSTYIILSIPTTESAGVSVADIYIDHQGMGWNKGTAFAVRKDGWLLTAFHTLNGSKGAALLEFDSNGTEILTPVQRIIAVEDNDFALVKLDKEVEPLEIFDDITVLQPGTEVSFMGYPLGETALFTHDGTISRVYWENGLPRYNLHAFVNSGQSGGPVFLSDGRVIGFMSARAQASNLPKRELVNPEVAGDNELMKILLDLKRGQDEIYNILSDELGKSSQMGIGIVIGINKNTINGVILEDQSNLNLQNG